MRGFLNIDKPAGMTSFDVVRSVRRAAGIKRVGHAGTLDPLATGVLPVAIGDATRLIDALVDADKAYTAEFTLGIETDTDDAEGEPVAEVPPSLVSALTDEAIVDALSSFEGEQMQVPPAYSAIKRAGVPAYRAARRGETVELAARLVIARSLRLVAREGAICRVEIECSKGYYVRSLARELGRALGVGAHVSALRRTRVGPFKVARAVPLDQVLSRLDSREDLDHLVHAADVVLTAWPAILLGEADTAAIRQGKLVSPALKVDSAAEATRTRVYGPDGYLVGMAAYTSAGGWQPLRILANHSPEPKRKSPAV